MMTLGKLPQTKSRRPIALTRKQLYQRVWSKPLSAVAREVGLSPNALAKICNRLLVPYPSRGHWTKSRPRQAAARPTLPGAPETQTQRVTISSIRAGSRRARTRLDPAKRREQLIEVAEKIIRADGLHAASMKRIAATAGISETQAYNYFGSREKLLVDLARREFGKIRAARAIDMERTHDHYSRVILTTKTYLREIGQRGDLLQTLLSSPEVRAMLRDEHRQQHSNDIHAHAQGLVELYGIPRAVALGCTVVLTRLCMNAGKLIADRKISLESGERLCLSMVLNGSRNIVGAANNPVGRAQSGKAT
jgi:AcrR family transcriptional regulator